MSRLQYNFTVDLKQLLFITQSHFKNRNITFKTIFPASVLMQQKPNKIIREVQKYCTHLHYVSPTLSFSHPVKAWTVVELSLLGYLVGQIVSWLTHLERGKKWRVRGEKKRGIKLAMGEVGGRIIWGMLWIYGETWEQQGSFRAW